jgi:hypothetical protein
MKRAMLESLVQWVKVVYADELKTQVPYRGSISSQKDLMDLNKQTFHQNLYSPDYENPDSHLNILNSYNSNPSSSAINPMATMKTEKNRNLEDDDCFMDDVGNEGINLIGVASDEEAYPDETPVEHLKIDEDSVRKSKVFKGVNKARSRYMDEDDQVHMDTEEEVYSKPNLHLGQLIFNNHNYVQNINMFPRSSQDTQRSKISEKSEANPNNNPYSAKKKKPLNASHGYLGKVAQKNIYNQLKNNNEKFSVSPENKINQRFR